MSRRQEIIIHVNIKAGDADLWEAAMPHKPRECINDAQRSPETESAEDAKPHDKGRCPKDGEDESKHARAYAMSPTLNRGLGRALHGGGAARCFLRPSRTRAQPKRRRRGRLSLGLLPCGGQRALHALRPAGPRGPGEANLQRPSCNQRRTIREPTSVRPTLRGASVSRFPAACRKIAVAGSALMQYSVMQHKPFSTKDTSCPFTDRARRPAP